MGTNTNLGIALLTAPLAAVPEGVTLQQGLPRVLAHLTMTDAEMSMPPFAPFNPAGWDKSPKEM